MEDVGKFGLVLALNGTGVELGTGILVIGSPLVVVCSELPELICSVLDGDGIELDVGIPLLDSSVLVVCVGIFELVCSVLNVCRVSTEDGTPKVEDNRPLVLEAPRGVVPAVVEIGTIRL
jgi:hypothetical protein